MVVLGQKACEPPPGKHFHFLTPTEEHAELCTERPSSLQGPPSDLPADPLAREAGVLTLLVEHGQGQQQERYEDDEQQLPGPRSPSASPSWTSASGARASQVLCCLATLALRPERLLQPSASKSPLSLLWAEQEGR